MTPRDDTAGALPSACSACRGTYCCPECTPVRAGCWICDGCRGAHPFERGDCAECDGTGWVPCEECDGADEGCDACVPSEPRPSDLQGAWDPPRCEACGDSEVCQECRPVVCSPDGLRLARERAGWSWAEAGHALGVEPWALRAMERGQRPAGLRPDQAARLAGRAGVSVDALRYYDPETYPRTPDAPRFWTQADEERRALWALDHLGDRIPDGQGWADATAARLHALADFAGDAAAEVLRQVARLIEPAHRLLDLRDVDDVDVAVALVVLAEGSGDQRAASRFDRLAYRLRTLDGLRSAIDSEDGGAVLRHLPPLFEDYPSTTAALDRLTREVMNAGC